MQFLPRHQAAGTRHQVLGMAIATGDATLLLLLQWIVCTSPFAAFKKCLVYGPLMALLTCRTARLPTPSPSPSPTPAAAAHESQFSSLNCNPVHLTFFDIFDLSGALLVRETGNTGGGLTLSVPGPRCQSAFNYAENHKMLLVQHFSFPIRKC